MVTALLIYLLIGIIYELYSIVMMCIYEFASDPDSFFTSFSTARLILAAIVVISAWPILLYQEVTESIRNGSTNIDACKEAIDNLYTTMYSRNDRTKGTYRFMLYDIANALCHQGKISTKGIWGIVGKHIIKKYNLRRN